jgi:hypothetical protein
MNMLDSI